MDKPIKIIFAGTPEFSVPYLEGLLNDHDFSVLGVLTQADKPSGRKQELSPAPVKIAAEKAGLKIWQPEKLKNNSEIIEELKKVGADLLIVVAYGQIIPQVILDIFPAGCLNVHPSLLPKYRGASPIQSALINGENKTGLTIILMDEKMDHGPILAQQELALTGEETNKSLHQQLALSGAPLLQTTIKKYLAGSIKSQEQNHDTATFCAPLAKTDARIDWQQPAQKIKQKIYAFYPWPTAWTTLNGQRLKIFPPVVVTAPPARGGAIPSKTELRGWEKKPGTILIDNNELAVVGGEGELILKKIQLEGRKEIPADDFIRGYQNLNGVILL